MKKTTATAPAPPSAPAANPTGDPNDAQASPSTAPAPLSAPNDDEQDDGDEDDEDGSALSATLDEFARTFEATLNDAMEVFGIARAVHIISIPRVDESDGTRRIRFVTAGGTKLCYPPDAACIATIRRVLKLADHEDLPARLTLPDWAITGEPTSDAHQHKGGYLRR